jgi:hypothetical protein
MPPKKSETSFCTESIDLVGKMLEMFENSTSKILAQMEVNFKKQTELMTSELFDFKRRLDDIESENKKLRKENELLRKGQDTLNEKLSHCEVDVDELEQNKIKDDVIVTGSFEVEALNSQAVANFLKKTCEADIAPDCITKISSFKNKKGQTVVKMSIPNVSAKISLLKCRKSLAKKKIIVNEALSNKKFQLLMAAKALCKQKTLFSAWSKEGKIFIKKTEEGTIQLVADKQHLNSFIV